MLRRQWYAVLQTKTLGRAPLALRRFGRDLVLWRSRQGVRCALDICAHRGAALSRGRVVDGCLECPYHGLQFNQEGHCTHVPATPAHIPSMALRTFPVREAHGLLWVFHGTEAEAGPLPWDEEFDAELHQDGGVFIDLCDTFDVSYTRVMENLTDFHHVAHVHRHTAPVPAEVTAFEARREGRHIHVSGTLGHPGDRGHMRATTHIVAPFLAHLHFEGLARFAAIATPIDDDHVWLFARYTQTLTNLPILDHVLTWALGAFDYRLLQRMQDVPVWRSQSLPAPADISRYTLLGPDEGIRLYFELHEELAS